MLLPSKAGVSFSWASAARELRGRPFNSASNGFILQLWEDQNHLYLMPSTVALLPRLCPSSTPMVPKGAKSALNNEFRHSLDLLSCPMASCSHLSSSTWPSPGLQQHNHLKISPNSSRTLLSFSSHCLLLWDPSFPKPVRCSHLPSHQKHWTQKANVAGNVCLKKKNTKAKPWGLSGFSSKTTGLKQLDFELWATWAFYYF